MIFFYLSVSFGLIGLGCGYVSYRLLDSEKQFRIAKRRAELATRHNLTVREQEGILKEEFKFWYRE